MAGELERALATVLRRPVELTVAGRTDRGVHALGQVVSYPGPPPRLRSVNAVLPGEVAVLAAEEAPAGFSARHDALSRTYLYRVLARRDAVAVRAPARAVVAASRRPRRARGVRRRAPGTHDFTAFTPTDTYHRRFSRDVLGAGLGREGDVLVFEIEADAFMRHMNRVLVGTMLEVAGGRRTVDDFARCWPGGRAPRPARPRPARPDRPSATDAEARDTRLTGRQRPRRRHAVLGRRARTPGAVRTAATALTGFHRPPRPRSAAPTRWIGRGGRRA